MSIKLTFLGTGGAFTDYRVNYHNNAIVETDEGPVLIDCGTTAVQSLKELGVKTWDVAGAVISHTHADHAGGLEQLVWERVYTGPGGAPGWLRTPIYAEHTVIDHLGDMLRHPLEEFADRNGIVQSNGYRRVVEAHGVLRPFEVGGVRFSLHRTPHVVGPGIDKPTYGVLVERGGSQVYYSGDTTFRPEIGDLFPRAGIIFHDCMFFPRFPGSVHTHYEELTTLPDDVRKRIVLMHHTMVPGGVNPVADGFLGAALRHDSFTVG